MVSQTQQLLEARKKGDFTQVDSKIKTRITRRRGRSKSPGEEDVERIIRDYADDFLLSRVINKKTAFDVVNDLERKDARNLHNFIVGVGREKFTNAVFDIYAEENIEELLDQELKLKTKTILGFRVNSRVYLRRTKAGIRAYRFKNNRFAKIPKSFFRE